MFFPAPVKSASISLSDADFPLYKVAMDAFQQHMTCQWAAPRPKFGDLQSTIALIHPSKQRELLTALIFGGIPDSLTESDDDGQTMRYYWQQF